MCLRMRIWNAVGRIESVVGDPVSVFDTDEFRCDAFARTSDNVANIPGIAVAVIRGNRIVYDKGFGPTLVTDPPIAVVRMRYYAGISATSSLARCQRAIRRC